MADPERQCFVFAPDVCVVWDVTFPLWEIIATLLLTAVVTYVTIRVSVRASRRETDRVLAAAATQREDDDRAHERAARTTLAQEMVRLSAAWHQLQLIATAKSEELLLAKAEWAALKIPFETSGLPVATELYDWANGSLHQAQRELSSGADASALDWVYKSSIDSVIAKRASSWASDPESVRVNTLREQEELRAERKRYIVDLREKMDALFDELPKDTDTPPHWDLVSASGAFDEG